VTTVTVTHSGSNKRNEILPLHQEVANRLEAHFTNTQVSNHSPNIQSQVSAILQEWRRICNKVQGTVLLHDVGDSTWERWVSPQPHGVITTRGPNRGVKRHHQWSGSQPAPYLPPRLTLLTLPWSSMLHEACTT
jgi:hypothetical protein